jgi:hypothetical protein
MADLNVLETIVREEILDGHEHFAPVDREEPQLGHASTYGQSNSLLNSTTAEASQGGGPLVDRHPDFIKLDGTPLSRIIPDNDHPSTEIAGDAMLIEFDSFSDDLSDDAKRSREANRNKLKNKPSLTNKLDLQYTPSNTPQSAPKLRPG